MTLLKPWERWLRPAASAAARPLGKLEEEMMEQVWVRGEVSVRDLHVEYSPQLAYTTLMTTLDRLYKKGLLDRRKRGKAFFYSARLTRQDFDQIMAEQLLNGLLAGDRSGALLSTFVNAVSERDRELLDQLEELIKTRRRELRRAE